jgi:hypothetical protein
MKGRWVESRRVGYIGEEVGGKKSRWVERRVDGWKGEELKRR